MYILGTLVAAALLVAAPVAAQQWTADDLYADGPFGNIGVGRAGISQMDFQARDVATDAVLYQGIGARRFERTFQLAEYVAVKGASLENGLLHVDLVRELPEAMKAQAIPIASSRKLLEVDPKLAA
jgi:hypothetical protein